MCSIEFLYVFDVAQIDEKSRVTDAFITSHNKVKADFFLVNEADRYIVCLLVEVNLEDHKCQIDLFRLAGRISKFLVKKLAVSERRMMKFYCVCGSLHDFDRVLA